jgi:drug/metabolite transporter (DMT)-like permease
VSTYAKVKPVVAVLLGYFWGGEALSLRTLAGTGCVLIGLVMITLMKATRPVASVTDETS